MSELTKVTEITQGEYLYLYNSKHLIWISSIQSKRVPGGSFAFPEPVKRIVVNSVSVPTFYVYTVKAGRYYRAECFIKGLTVKNYMDFTFDLRGKRFPAYLVEVRATVINSVTI